MKNQKIDSLSSKISDLKNASIDFTDLNEQCRQLEEKYLIAVKNHDSKLIDANYQRKMLRRRRQTLIDKERDLAKRQKYLELESNKAQRSDSSQAFLKNENAKKEIAQLQARLHNTIKLIQRTKNPQYSNSSLNASLLQGDETDQDFIMSILKKQEKELRSKREELDNRQMAAQQKLSDPLDDITLDEMMIEDFEQDNQLAEAQLSLKIKQQKDVDMGKQAAKIEKLEIANQHRKKVLKMQQTELTATKRQIDSQTKPIINPKSPQKKQMMEIDKTVPQDKLNSFIEEICATLLQRQNQLNAEEKEIDQLDAKNKSSRKSIEIKWNKKVEEIKKKTQQIRENDQLSMKIYELGELIENESHQLRTLIDEKKRIKRRIQNILRDKEYNSKQNQEHQKLLLSIKKRQKEQKEKDIELESKKKYLKQTSKNIKSRESEVFQMENHVIALEKQLAEIESKNEETIAKVQQISAEFEESRALFSSTHTENFRMAFESSLLGNSTDDD